MAKVWIVKVPKKNPRWLKCPKCRAWMIQEKYFYCPSCGTVYNPINNPKGLYESFHGTLPLRKRKVLYEPPKSPLIKIGRLVRIEYEPEHPSKRKNIRFYHEMGDTGSSKLRSNTILATDKKGENLYILRDNGSKRPTVTSRGIIG